MAAKNSASWSKRSTRAGSNSSPAARAASSDAAAARAGRAPTTWPTISAIRSRRSSVSSSWSATRSASARIRSNHPAGRSWALRTSHSSSSARDSVRATRPARDRETTRLSTNVRASLVIRRPSGQGRSSTRGPGPRHYEQGAIPRSAVLGSRAVCHDSVGDDPADDLPPVPSDQGRFVGGQVGTVNPRCEAADSPGGDRPGKGRGTGRVPEEHQTIVRGPGIRTLSGHAGTQLSRPRTSVVQLFSPRDAISESFSTDRPSGLIVEAPPRGSSKSVPCARAAPGSHAVATSGC